MLNKLNWTVFFYIHFQFSFDVPNCSSNCFDVAQLKLDWNRDGVYHHGRDYPLTVASLFVSPPAKSIVSHKVVTNSHTKRVSHTFTSSPYLVYCLSTHFHLLQWLPAHETIGAGEGGRIAVCKRAVWYSVVLCTWSLTPPCQCIGMIW